jgi:1-acyl-sn-glycerol-3-phosphate acyltransferase
VSETGTSIARSEEAGRREHTPDAQTLPAWVLTVLRVLAGLLLRLLWRLHYVGAEHVPQTGRLIIAANHQTYIDPFWLAAPINRPLRFLAWDESFSWPVVGKCLRWLGAWPLQVERSDPRAIRRSLQWLRQEGALVIFPEGGRAFANGALQEFKVGALRIALETDTPILPVTIRGGQTVWPRGQRFPRFLRRVEIIYHPLHRLTPLPGEDTRACARRETEELARIISSAL